MLTKKNGKTLLVQLDSELDHHYAESIRNKIDSEIRANNIKYLIFDFSKVKFMDSSGLGVIMGRYKLIQSMGGKVSAFGLGAQIDKLIKMSGINKLVSIYDTESEALK